MPIRPMTEDDRDRVIAVRRASFNTPASFAERFRDMPLDGHRVWEESGVVVAAAVALDFASYFGRRPVQTAGVSGVVVAPEARGRRLAERIVGTMLAELDPGIPLTSLYPATVPLYRRLGYEFAAHRTLYKTQISALTRFEGAGDMAPWSDQDLDEVMEAQRAYVGEHNATLMRSREWWARRLFTEWSDRPVYRYLVREGGKVTGSVVYTQENDWHYAIECRDVFWTTPYAARTILSFFARHASLGNTVEWFGPPVEPLLFLVAQDKVRKDFTDGIQYPMFRVLDVAGAIQQRGYQTEDATAVSVAIDDELFARNRGPWRISVDGGKGIAEPADKADATIPAGIFAALYTGFLNPVEGRRAGLFTASDAAVDALGRIFAGPAPWASDFF